MSVAEEPNKRRPAGYLWLLVPILLMLAFTVAMELLAGITDQAWISSTLYAVAGITGTVAVLVSIRHISGRLRIDAPAKFRWRYSLAGLGVGLGTGLILSVSCGLLFHHQYGTASAAPIAASLDPSRALRNIGPALLEEASMRAGVVYLLNGLNGAWAGLAGGSIPFGLLHLFGRLFGNPVDFAHVIGTTASGLLLSILYLRFGFWAAFGCHWVWNSLAVTWVRYAGVELPGGVQEFEGSVGTVLLLILACLCLMTFGDRGWLTRTPDCRPWCARPEQLNTHERNETNSDEN